MTSRAWGKLAKLLYWVMCLPGDSTDASMGALSMVPNTLTQTTMEFFLTQNLKMHVCTCIPTTANENIATNSKRPTHGNICGERHTNFDQGLAHKPAQSTNLKWLDDRPHDEPDLWHKPQDPENTERAGKVAIPKLWTYIYTKSISWYHVSVRHVQYIHVCTKHRLHYTYIWVSEDGKLQNKLYNSTSCGEEFDKVPQLLEIVLFEDIHKIEESSYDTSHVYVPQGVVR